MIDLRGKLHIILLIKVYQMLKLDLSITLILSCKPLLVTSYHARNHFQAFFGLAVTGCCLQWQQPSLKFSAFVCLGDQPTLCLSTGQNLGHYFAFAAFVSLRSGTAFKARARWVCLCSLTVLTNKLKLSFLLRNQNLSCMEEEILWRSVEKANIVSYFWSMLKYVCRQQLKVFQEILPTFYRTIKPIHISPD